MLRFGKAIACIAVMMVPTGVFASVSVAQLKQALDQSSSSGKPLLAVAGAEWCGPCKVLDKMLHTEWRAVGQKFIYVHIDVDHDKEAWSAFTKKYPKPGNGIPMIFVVKPDGELGFSQCGYSPKLLDTFKKFAGESYAAKPTLTNKEIGVLRNATKDANDLLKRGKFASAYEKLAEYADHFSSEHRVVMQAKKAYDEAVKSAVARIDEAVKEVEEPLGAKRFEGAYHLTIISRTFNESEDVKKKVTDAIAKLSANEKLAELLKQAELYDMARQAERDESVSKAKEIYAKIVEQFKSSPGARKAQQRLDEIGT